jgi:hypothetical protein
LTLQILAFADILLVGYSLIETHVRQGLSLMLSGHKTTTFPFPSIISPIHRLIVHVLIASLIATKISTAPVSEDQTRRTS